MNLTNSSNGPASALQYEKKEQHKKTATRAHIKYCSPYASEIAIADDEKRVHSIQHNKLKCRFPHCLAWNYIFDVSLAWSSKWRYVFRFFFATWKRLSPLVKFNFYCTENCLSKQEQVQILSFVVISSCCFHEINAFLAALDGTFHFNGRQQKSLGFLCEMYSN